MFLTNSERAPILTVIGFVFFLVGALAIPKEFYIQILFAIGAAVFFVLALFFVMKEEIPMTSIE